MSEPISACTIVGVALNRPLFELYDYILPEASRAPLLGRRVSVSFGRGKHRAVGIIAALHDHPPEDVRQLKEARLLDEQPLIEHDVLETLRFASRYYHYPLGQCLHAALPKLLREGGSAGYQGIEALELTADGAMNSQPGSQEQRRIVEMLRLGPVRRQELRERGLHAKAENALLKKGLVKKITLSPSLVPFVPDAHNIIRNPGPELNPDQAAAVAQVCARPGFGVFLLNGVTGSGKTEVYLNIIAHTLEQGRKALVLVPEIALTPQTFERFYARFRVPIASLHSSLSDRERCNAFLDMKYEKAWILIGTRSALFAPIANLGLIVIDEEQDPSFKQNDGFRYHTRSLAIIRARLQQAWVVLGSATPSLESIANCQCGKFTALTLPERAGGASLPSLELIDLKKQPLSEGLRCGICGELEERIGLETARGNQVLLFLNRRGYSRSLICHDCAHIFMCPNCDCALTVHHQARCLCCHICGIRLPLPDSCPKCSSRLLLENGYGTEQVEEFLKLRYPDTGVVRIDRDTIKKRADLERSLRQISSGKAQILLGTQMLAKGHDFPDVTLVGILDVDASLYCDDFRAHETAAQLITQVAGRAGRAAKPGKVIIQSHTCSHRLLHDLAIAHCNYAEIAAVLLAQRHHLLMPPYGHLAFALASSSVRQHAFDYLCSVHAFITGRYRHDNTLFISPVVSDKIERRHGRYHFHILFRAPPGGMLHTLLDDLTLRLPAELKLPGDCRYAIDMDPVQMY